MIGTILSLCSAAKQVADTYSMVTGLVYGDPNTRLLTELVQHQQAMRIGIERLSDNILYAPDLHAIKDITHHNNQRALDGQAAREYLEPTQLALKQPIFSAALIVTPDKMQQAVAKNPWEVLHDVRELSCFNLHIPPEGVLIQFERKGVWYMGWQLRGALPLLFNCELQDLLDTTKHVNTPKVDAASVRLQSIMEPFQVFRDNLRDGGMGPEMVVLPSGEFRMGCVNDRFAQPLHRVRINYQFAVGRYPVTFYEYDHFCSEEGITLADDNNWGRGNQPLINISWYDANAYCVWLSTQTGRIYRLLSEAEWEYACRAGTQGNFYWKDRDGIKIHQYAWYNGNSDGRTQPIGGKQPNAWELYDTIGNVWEWCQDRWHDDYTDAPTDGTAWEKIGFVSGLVDRLLHGNTDNRLLRGGSWSSSPARCRPSARLYLDANQLSSYCGLRVCCLTHN